MSQARKAARFPWRPCLYELSGTAVLVLVGLSLVIVMFGTGSPMAQLVPHQGLRRLITGFLFGTTGAAIALSVVGKESGAHINPPVTMVFWLFRRLDSRTAGLYVMAQLAGGILGALPLLAWGAMGRSVAFGSIGRVRCSAPSWRRWLAAFSPNESPSPSSTISIVTATGCSEEWDRRISRVTRPVPALCC